MEIHGSLGFKMHCWAGWWGHVPLLDAILSATEISVLNLAADLDLVGAGVTIHALGGRLGLKKHCRAGWRGHVPLLDTGGH